ncbi:alcohol dehydrogenase [Planoprotostelium fungivorum]|uniref:Alcohol dehydrogenase n=1 Tax=Planoprotostelium fungivorum TaxID=1890364 RepID=A0A2P6MW50_9EUKA|nr:alcohol dehydrogenase [Planoprotostelium fungivorum]
MKAAAIHKWNDAPQLTDVAAPAAPTGNDVLVRVVYSSINPLDWKLASGLMAIPGLPTSWPKHFGQDLSGEVIAVGPSVTHFKVGDHVYGTTSNGPKGSGAHAERVVCNDSSIAHKPKNISHQEAASIPLAALTAYGSIFGSGHLTAGQSVLILGASGGVGHLGVQIAKAKGAKVYASCGTDKVDYVKGLGADQVVDYKTEKLNEKLKGKEIDVLFDCIGAKRERELAFPLLKRGGIAVTINPIDDTTGQSFIFQVANSLKDFTWGNLQHYYYNRSLFKLYFFTPNNTREQLEEVSKMVEEGKVKTEVAQVFPLSQVGEAFKKSKEGRTKGKIVIEVSK